MKIKYLKINGFGKIKNKEINFNDNINLIYGKNESGKTTLLNFIFAMFYGLSRNKSGKEFSNFDRYKPWKGEEFSGKLRYILDNNEKFEIFREFAKKNPKIYNSNSEDISSHFNFDKNKNNQFFYDQTKVDETLLLSTNIVGQQQTVLDSNNQNLLTQKIANILSSGEDEISYKKVMEKLSKELLEEVGTDRSTDRPLNKITDEINQILKTQNELEKDIVLNDEMKNKKNELIQKLNSEKNTLAILNKIKEIKEKNKVQNERININKKIVNEYAEKINNLKRDDNSTNKNEQKSSNKKNIINYIIITILIILNIIINFIKLNNIVENIIIYFSIIYLICNLIYYLYNRSKFKKMNIEHNIRKIETQKAIEILEENKKNKQKEIIELEKDLLEDNNKKIQLLKNHFKGIINVDNINNYFNKDILVINHKIEEINRQCVNKKLEINTIQIKEKEFEKKLEDKITYDERLKYLQDEKEQLLKLAQSINIAKEALEEAYNSVKEKITPKFTKDLSLMVEKFSSGKYKKTIYDTEQGLIIEREDGKYVNCNRLSIGTIEQLYLSLRLSTIRQLVKETMPIILDESFAYCDTERLKNILKYINENYKKNQILILACSCREKEIMDSLNLKYNLITL